MTRSSSPGPTLVVEADAAATARRAADEVAALLTKALDQRGHAAVALSGGNSPRPMFRDLAIAGLDWSRIEVFQVDERVVPDASPDRNWQMVEAELLDPAQVPARCRHPMPVLDQDLVAAASHYGALLRSRAAAGLDVVHLGLGDDGHTASWPPDDPIVESKQDVELVAAYRGHQRMTLTPRAINQATNIVWLVEGQSKRHALSALLNADPRPPSHAVRRSPGVWVFTEGPWLE